MDIIPDLFSNPSPSRNGDQCFELTYQRHREALLRGLRSRLRDADLAEDVCQEAFARLLRAYRAGREPERPEAWLHRVATNLVISQARHTRVVAARTPVVEEAGGPDPTLAAVLGQELAGELGAALRRLDDDQRAVLLLAARGASAAQVAERFGTSDTAARARLHRARRRLREELTGRSAGCVVTERGARCTHVRPRASRDLEPGHHRPGRGVGRHPACPR
jgi:RNA polymerase sigma-70 factor (ECF subfamily)